jgi:hypothetical protein
LEGDLRPVRRPDGTAVDATRPAETTETAAIGVDRVDVEAAAAVAREGEAAAAGRPARSRSYRYVPDQGPVSVSRVWADPSAFITQSWKLEQMKAMRDPSGDHAGSSASPSGCVRVPRPLPSGLTVATCHRAFAKVEKAILPFWPGTIEIAERTVPASTPANAAATSASARSRRFGRTCAFQPSFGSGRLPLLPDVLGSFIGDPR